MSILSYISSQRGYPLDEFVHEPPDDLICPRCLQVLKDPKQCCKRAHAYCASCLTRMNGCLVPVCLKEDNTPVVSVVSIDNRIKQLKVKCKCKLTTHNKHLSPCQWSGIRSERDARQCEHELDAMPVKCSSFQPFKSEHYICEDCNEEIELIQRSQHNEQCGYSLIVCPLFRNLGPLRGAQCTGSNIRRKDMTAHLQHHRNELRAASGLVDQLLGAGHGGLVMASGSTSSGPSFPRPPQVANLNPPIAAVVSPAPPPGATPTHNPSSTAALTTTRTPLCVTTTPTKTFPVHAASFPPRVVTPSTSTVTTTTTRDTSLSVNQSTVKPIASAAATVSNTARKRTLIRSVTNSGDTSEEEEEEEHSPRRKHHKRNDGMGLEKLDFAGVLLTNREPRPNLNVGYTWTGKYNIHGERTGPGVWTCPGNERLVGYVYEGTMVRGVREGEGTCTYKNGEKYAGMWRWGSKHGRGEMEYADGSVDVGEWKRNKKKKLRNKK